MFDIEKAIVDWKKQLTRQEGLEPGYIDELESHLRDSIDEFIAEGLTEELAFEKAITERMGKGRFLANEFLKARTEDMNKRPPWESKTGIGIMLPNYLRVALRNLNKNKLYTGINTGGLIIGMMSAVFLALYVFQELSYDNFHPNVDRVYRIQMDRYVNDELSFNSAVTFPAVGPATLRDIPETEDFTRILPFGTGTYSYQNRAFNEQKAVFADSNYFHFFGFELLEGDPNQVLNKPNTVVISESIATKYFGSDDPIGEVITRRGTMDLTVTGIFADMQSNSHLSHEILVSMSSWVGGTNYADFEDQWAWYDFYTYVRLAPGTNVDNYESKLAGMMNVYKGEFLAQFGWLEELLLQPITDIHLYSNLSWEAGVNGDATSVYFLLVAAVLILVIAWVNFINLATARSVKRSLEVGVRKALGARKGQLIYQFMTESFLINTIAILAALLMVDVLRPVFSSNLGVTVPSLLSMGLQIPVIIVLMLLLGTFLSGIYPALFLSSYNPLAVLKGKVHTSNRGFGFRQVLVVFQFSISIILITGTLFVIQQLNYMKSQDLGINIDQTLVLNAPNARHFGEDGRSSLLAFKNEMLKHSDIKSFTTTSIVPGVENFGIGGYATRANPDEYKNIYNVRLGEDFVDIFEIAVLAGRSFDFELMSDTSAALLNQSAIELLNLGSPEEAVGSQIVRGELRFDVIGVINNYHQASLKENVQPAIFFPNNEWDRYLAMKVSSNNIQTTLDNIRQDWEAMFPGNPLEYYFLDQLFEEQYLAEDRFQTLFIGFALLAILVACLGLFGLSAFTAEQSMKEIAIRKVLGASSGHIVSRLSSSFLKLIVVAMILAIPLSFFLIRSWLNDFAFHMDMNVWTFLISGILSLVIAMFTVGYQGLKASRQNPIKSIKAD